MEGGSGEKRGKEKRRNNGRLGWSGGRRKGELGKKEGKSWRSVIQRKET